MRKLTILIFLALAIAALPLIGTTADDEAGDAKNVGMSADEAAASSCANINFGGMMDEDFDADASTDDGSDDTDMLSDFTDTPLQGQSESGETLDAGGADIEGMTEMELPCEPPKPDNTVICYDGDTPLNCNIVNGQYICP